MLLVLLNATQLATILRQFYNLESLIVISLPHLAIQPACQKGVLVHFALDTSTEKICNTSWGILVMPNSGEGSARSQTRTTEIGILGANHYTTEPLNSVPLPEIFLVKSAPLVPCFFN